MQKAILMHVIATIMLTNPGHIARRIVSVRGILSLLNRNSVARRTALPAYKLPVG